MTKLTEITPKCPYRDTWIEMLRSVMSEEIHQCLDTISSLSLNDDPIAKEHIQIATNRIEYLYKLLEVPTPEDNNDNETI